MIEYGAFKARELAEAMKRYEAVIPTLEVGSEKYERTMRMYVKVKEMRNRAESKEQQRSAGTSGQD